MLWEAALLCQELQRPVGSGGACVYLAAMGLAAACDSRVCRYTYMITDTRLTAVIQGEGTDSLEPSRRIGVGESRDRIVKFSSTAGSDARSLDRRVQDPVPPAMSVFITWRSTSIPSTGPHLPEARMTDAATKPGTELAAYCGL